MSFDFFRHDVNVSNKRTEEAEAKRKLEYELSIIRQNLQNSILDFARENGNLTESGGANSEITLYKGNFGLGITVHGGDDFTVKNLSKQSTVPQLGIGSRVNKDDMMTKVIDFIRS